MFEFKNWLETLEYEDFNIPKPDQVFFLKVPENYSIENINTR